MLERVKEANRCSPDVEIQTPFYSLRYERCRRLDATWALWLGG